MKKSRIKNYLKLIILLFSISLLTTNCEKTEDSLKEETISKPRFSIELITYETFSKNSKLFEKIQKLDKSTNLNKSSRSVYNENYGFTVDLDDSKYLESDNGNYHSYTFTITRDEPIDLLENLLVSLQPNGSYKTLITAYHLLDFNTFGVAYQEIDFNTDTVFSKTAQFRDCITWTTCEIWDYFCTDCESESPEWTYSCGLYSTHEACDFIDAGDSSIGGGTSSNSSSAPFINNGSQWDNTFWSTGSRGETSNTGNDSNTDNPSDNNEPCIQDANGNCIGDATSPKVNTIKTVDEKNCEELQKLGNNTLMRQSYQDIQNKVNLDREFGYSFAINALPEERELANGNPINLNMPHGGLIYGGSHTHPFESHPDHKIFPMFSLADLGKLGLLAIKHSNPGVSKNYNLFVLTMTVKNGTSSETFAIKIDDFIQFVSSFINPYYNKSKRDRKRFGRVLNDKYDYTDKHGGGNVAENYLKDLFKFMVDKNINGMSVFKAKNTNLTNWEKLTYNTEDNIIERANCN